MAIDKKKRKLLIQVMAALGLVTAGNVMPGVFSFDYDSEPPALVASKSFFQRAHENGRELDLYRAGLRFTKPVSLSGEVTLTLDGKTVKETVTEPTDYATFWLFYFSPDDNVRWKNENTAVQGYSLTVRSIGGETAEVRK